MLSPYPSLSMNKDSEAGAIKMPPLYHGVRLQDRVGPQSHYLFQALGIGTGFLSEPVNSWAQIPSYVKFSNFVANLQVTNDESERLVRRTVVCASTSPQGEQEFQGQLQMVGSNISRLPQRDTKKKLIEAYQKKSH